MLVQGGGGNTSVKEKGGTMLVKASGAALGDMDTDRGWVRLDLTRLDAVLDRADLKGMEPARRETEVLDALMDARVPPFKAETRPTVEANLHALLSRYVVHTHPIAMNALACARSGREAASRIFRRWTPPPLWIRYVDPGFPLALETRRALATYSREHGVPPKVIFYQNHGLFVASDSFREALALTQKVIGLIDRNLKKSVRLTKAPAPLGLAAHARQRAITGISLSLRSARSRRTDAASFVRFSNSPPLARFAASTEAAKIVRSGQLTPDEVVYCLRHGCYLDRSAVAAAANGDARPVRKAFTAHRKKHGYLPKIVTAADLGLFAAGTSVSDSSNALLVYESAVLAIEKSLAFGGPRFLTKRQAEYIDTWEVPRYRRTFYVESEQERPLAGRIAIVTGAASGLGRGISLGLARAGASTALLDIDLASAEETAKRIAYDVKGEAIALHTDVTDEDSVAVAFFETVRQFGGLDILVNAAGIAPAFPLTDFPVDAWKKTLDINLTGYFLAGREAARIFVRQNMGGNIINLSSKTGLDASVNNTAYNATKSGEIHLARGWALELGKHGIRVNAVAPGNVFKGSKIWNDEYIRVVAKKRGLRPAEVIPYYNSLTALKKEIEPDDVANAIVFLCSNAARRITGQTLVCDGGQVLVR